MSRLTKLGSLRLVYTIVDLKRDYFLKYFIFPRASWFGAMGSVIERFGATFGDAHGSRVTRILLAGAHERNPLVAHQLWGCLLTLCYSVPVC